MSIYKEFISTLIEKLVDLGYLKEKPIGEDIKYINKIERHFKIKLPELYKEFLLQMGVTAAGDGLGVYSYFYLGIYDKFYAQRIANEILKSDKSKHYPLKNKWVIGIHQEYVFDFIPTDFGDNPPVCHYLECETDPLNGEIHYESFSEYIISYIYSNIIDSNYSIYIDKKPVKGDGSCWCLEDECAYDYIDIQNKKEYIKKEVAIIKEFEYISTALRKIIPKKSEVK